jgi:hypothetical protein
MYNRLLISTQALYPKYALNKALSLAFLRLLSNGYSGQSYNGTGLPDFFVPPASYNFRSALLPYITDCAMHI